MTPHEKAVHALNARLERLQTNLREAQVEAAQRFLLQSVVVAVGLGEALNDFGRGVGQFAQRRHAALKDANERLSAQHAELLKTGQALLEQWKANPKDKALRKEIDRVQQAMETVQKTLRRAANTLQRELAPGLAQIDELAVSVRRFAEAEQGDALKRVLKTLVGQVRTFYADQPGLPAKELVEAASWETTALAEIDQAADFYDAVARAGYQALLALELMTLAVAEQPPATREEAAQRASTAVAARVKAITARLTGAAGSNSGATKDGGA